MKWLRRALAVGGYRAALRHRDVRLLLGSQTVSMTGNWAYNVALLAYVFERTHSLAWVGAASTLRLLPGLLLSPYGGVIAERFERRQVMFMCNLGALVCQAALVAVAAAHGPAWAAIALALLTGVMLAPYEPCVGAMIPAVAGEADLPAANALVHTIENLVLLLGPALGALLLVLFSAPVVFALNAGSFGAAAVMVSRIGVRSTPVDVTEGGSAGLFAQLAVGLRTLGSSRRIVVLVGGTALGSFLYGTDTVQLVGVATERLGTGPEGYGWLLGAAGVGGILAALVADRISRQPRVGTLIVGGIAALCLPTLLLVVIRSPVLASAIQVIRGAGMLIVDILATIGLQRAVPADKLGRVFGVLWAIILGSMVLGAAVTSPVIDAVGLSGSLWLTGLVPLGLAAVCWPVLRSVDAEAAAALDALRPRLEVLTRSPYFGVADRAALERLASASVELEVPAGADLVREGEPADALYVIVDGAVEVTAAGRDAPRSLGRLGPEEVFGEIGLLQRVPRTATVTTSEPSRVLRIDGDAFLEALTSDPLAAMMTETARQRLTDQPASDEALEPVP